ncbi:hypothetical protein E2C01_003702 [Portunus trituberculatus]|uniref:Uncharacterized protein n=1 Tax=Portunus trituberculatus TaxID=210409 RepID=A0A5B7CNN9_PORTR|nr:hypothetical protein [Portunus trituberculatus]
MNATHHSALGIKVCDGIMQRQSASDSQYHILGLIVNGNKEGNLRSSTNAAAKSDATRSRSSNSEANTSVPDMWNIIKS